MKTSLSIVLALLLTGLALVYALWNVDVAELRERLEAGNYLYLLPFLLCMCGHYWLKALRWARLLRPLGRFEGTEVLPAVMVGFAGNNLLPVRLGELVRSLYFARRFDQSITGVISSLVLERLLDVIAILGWFLIALLFASQVPESLRETVWAVATVVAIACVPIIFVLIWPQRALGLWKRLSGVLPERWFEVVESRLSPALRVLEGVKSTTGLATLVLNSLLQWGFTLGMLWVSLLAFGVSVSLPTLALLLTVLAFAVALPSVPGYVGIIQAAFVFALVPFGVAEESAFAASLFFLVAHWVPVTLTGLAFFAASGLEMASVLRNTDG